MVKPMHPFQGGQFQGRFGFPRRTTMDQFGLVQSIDGFCQGVVVAVSQETLFMVLNTLQLRSDNLTGNQPHAHLFGALSQLP